MATTALVAGIAVVLARPSGTAPGSVDGIRVGAPAPAIAGTTLDGTAFDLASLRGRPVLVNFWGPSCVPCRDEFPLFTQMLAEHASDRLAIVGVLYQDDPPSARTFAADFHATWPTVVDASGSAARAYRVVARPQSYFIDAQGTLLSIQVGQLTRADFERQLAALGG